VVRLRAEPDVTIQRHRHTGEVFAFTIAGAWKYLEYPEVNVAGILSVRAGRLDPHPSRPEDEQRSPPTYGSLIRWRQSQSRRSRQRRVPWSMPGTGWSSISPAAARQATTTQGDRA
jgi:hypothetical protein